MFGPKIISSLRFNSATRVSRHLCSMSSHHELFIKETAKVEVPANINLLMDLFKLRGDTVVSPSDRKGLIPFLIPLTKTKEGSITSYIRWPTQKEGTPLQIVRTTEAGITLLALDTNQLIHRLIVELDFNVHPEAPIYIEKLNNIGINYKSGDYIPMIKSGKFPTLTKDDLSLVLDRFILSKVGSFPDCLERLAENFLKNGSEVSAFVTGERAVTVFYGWGSPMRFNALLMSKVKGREAEAVSVIVYMCIYHPS